MFYHYCNAWVWGLEDNIMLFLFFSPSRALTHVTKQGATAANAVGVVGTYLILGKNKRLQGHLPASPV